MPYNATLPQQLRSKHDAVKAHDGTHCTLFCGINALIKFIKFALLLLSIFSQISCMETGRVQI